MLFFRAVTASLILHIFLLWLLQALPPPNRSKPVPVEFEVVKNDQQEKTFLRDNVDPKEEDNRPNPKARTYSKKTVRVDDETQAMMPGPTQNRSGTGPGKEAQGEKKNQKQQAKKEQTKSKTLGTEWVPRFIPPSQDVGGGGLSTIADRLPDDVRVGRWTSRNSERFLFYSFFSRIEERVYFRWATRIRQSAEKYDQRALAKQEWVTKIEIILNKNGYFEEAIIHDRSGIMDFDQAAAIAFKEGAPYLNPPAELVRDDGRIHLLYSVSVVWRPSSHIQ